MTPKPAEPNAAPGLPKFVKNSPRNSVAIRSVTRNLRNSEKSRFTIPGPRMMPAPALPNVYAAGCAKAEASNQRVTLRWSEGRLGLLSRLRPLRSRGEAVAVVGLSGDMQNQQRQQAEVKGDLAGVLRSGSHAISIRQFPELAAGPRLRTDRALRFCHRCFARPPVLPAGWLPAGPKPS